MVKHAQDWFEMKDVVSKGHAKAVWIPLRVSKKISSEGDIGYLGYNEEFYGANSLMVPASQKETALKLGWNRLNLSNDHVGYCNGNRYVSSDAYDDDGLNGTYLVLQNSRILGQSTEWYLHQDIILTLGLIREGDEWLRPSDGYEVVARIESSKQHRSVGLYIRATYLKDYLCARNCGLYVSSYRSRTEICESANHIAWPESESKKEENNFRWEGYVTEIHNGGPSYGGGVAYIHVARTDADPEDDVPSMDGPPTDENTTGFAHHSQHPGEKVYSILGQLWKEEWIAPGTASPIVRDDNVPSDVSFIVDGDGNSQKGDDLRDLSIWLWFKPDLVPAILSIRGAELSWSTRDVGTLTCCGTSINFGVNEEGFINVFAKDVSFLPIWLQKKYAGFNTSVTGKVSKELFAAQGRGEFLDTKAPEPFLLPALERIRELSIQNLGVDITVNHAAMENIAKQCYRFRSLNKDGLLTLAKDLARLSADAFVKNRIAKIITLGQEGSLKSVEKLLATKIGAQEAYKMVGPLFHIYDLRLSDAHLPKDDEDVQFKALGISEEVAWPVKGFLLLKKHVDTLWEIGNVLRDWKKDEKSFTAS